MVERYHLVPDTISTDTVKALEELHQQALNGEIIGIAFSAMYSPRGGKKRYIVDWAGECWDSPTFTRGMVLDLLWKLQQYS